MPSEYAVDPTGVGHVLGLQQMGEIKIALTNEAMADSMAATPAASMPVKTQPVMTAPPVVPAIPASSPAPQTAKSVASAPTKSNKMTVNLMPGEGREIKLEMVKGANVRYEWTTSGGAVNFETHGEPYNGKKGYFHSYGKGKQAMGDSGDFTAMFDGTHGWFWRNRGDAPVTVFLATNGEYSNVK
jgi:hypothetical protein